MFMNANHFSAGAKRRIAESEEAVREVLVDCETMNLLDTTGAAALVELAGELRGQDIKLSLARVRDPVRERIRSTGVESEIGEDHIYETISEGVHAFENG